MAIALLKQHDDINVMNQCDIWRDNQDVPISSDCIKKEVRERL